MLSGCWKIQGLFASLSFSIPGGGVETVSLLLRGPNSLNTVGGLALASPEGQRVLEVQRGRMSVPAAACGSVYPHLLCMDVWVPSTLPQSPCVCLCACLSLSGQLFVQSVYYLYSMCIFVLVQLFSVFLPDSPLLPTAPPPHVCRHVGTLSI